MINSFKRLIRTSRAISSVVTAMILSASVLVIGGAVWAFSNNSSSVMGSNYFDEVNVRVDQARERFVVENIELVSESCLRVWVYNYGEIDINATTYVFRNGVAIGQITSQVIQGGEVKQLDITVQALSTGDELVVKVNSVRDNAINESYLVW